MPEINIKNFLEVSYEELEELNLGAKKKVIDGVPVDQLKERYLKYLTDEKSLKAVTVCFSDLEGRLHMLDYDRRFLLGAHDALTFDGSSIRGFSVVKESDLRLEIDWGSFRWLPTDVFGPGKVIVFGLIKDRNGAQYSSDMRGRLIQMEEELMQKHGYKTNVSVELEGFVFRGISAEQSYSSRKGFEFVSSGGYFNSLPRDPLKLFIDALAEAQRALGFENEKDHPEVAPSQFELNYKYAPATLAADQVLLYKLLARQIAANFGLTASFLPKPVAMINGNGMHTNLSVSRDGKNLFYDPKGEDNLADFAWQFVDRILNNANDICLVTNPSVNAFRRLDPHFEAPNQIKASAIDRTSMVRVPLANEKSSRIEVRNVSPDANPYMLFYSIFGAGFDGPMTEILDEESRRTRTRFLPGNIYDAMRHFKGSNFVKELLGEQVHTKYLELKNTSANRCPRELGSIVKTEEILFHHEVTNQLIWSNF